MKLVLSRKSLDSSFGPFPSPVLPDGKMLPIFIPDSSDSRKLPTYDELWHGGLCLGSAVESLSRSKIRGSGTAHVDPDLDWETMPRLEGWRPAFGQHGSALRHLENQCVGIGDLFLFFGWFRNAVWQAGKLRYEDGSPDFQALYGWLQVGSIVDANSPAREEWLEPHPHFQRSEFGAHNKVFVASDELCVGGCGLGVPGGGAFPRLHDALVLTEPGKSRSNWSLPACFYPAGRTPLTYHGDKSRWKLEGEKVLLRSVGRGQEFVLDCDEYPEVLDWLQRDIFDNALCF